MDAAEYKHVVLGLIFLKYISDSFEELYAKLKANPEADPEDKDEYTAKNVFWVPLEARWNSLKTNAKNLRSASWLMMRWWQLSGKIPGFEEYCQKSMPGQTLIRHSARRP